MARRTEVVPENRTVSCGEASAASEPGQHVETAGHRSQLDPRPCLYRSLPLPRGDRDRRLLLALYAAGTNAGIKRVVAGVSDVSYNELLHIRRRHVDPNALRVAASRVANSGSIQKPWNRTAWSITVDSVPLPHATQDQ